MSNTPGDVLDRPASGRFVRNLALSLGGGALVTLLGATAAQAQDGGAAGTASDGAGAAHSGDATAVGNRSGTTKNQTTAPSGALGNLQVVDQTAAVANVGVAVANTGGNIAVGNNSDNLTDVDQTSASEFGGATNSGTSANASNGSALISTGNASAVGNESVTTINQSSHGAAYGQLGSILILPQNAVVTNSGVALANSGLNSATGNQSQNEAGLLQEAYSTAGLAANSGKAANNSNGLATISTGNASATGNKSETQVLQSTSGSAGGDPGGLLVTTQTGIVINFGIGVANSGGNVAVGNESNNEPTGLLLGDAGGAFVGQNIGDDGPPPEGPVGVASNNGEASNWSDGTGVVITGDAGAWGNDSKTHLSQTADADVDGFGVSIDVQAAAVLNAGAAVANTGLNSATGNTSRGGVEVDQDIPVSGGTDVGVAGNFALGENASDGTAVVQTGGAYAAGNRSSTAIEQVSESNGGWLNLQPQIALVGNVGVGVANSGINVAIGNQSVNQTLFGPGAFVEQDATLSEDPGLDLGVVGQFGKASNSSDGTAAIVTGTASAVGNDSDTGIGQTIDPAGFVVNTQVAAVVNAGVGVANSGVNAAVGNASTSNANAVQGAEVGVDNDNTAILAGTIVESNNGEAANTSDGLATISTGDAAATGNESGTNIRQEANGAIDGNGFALNTQAAVVANVGVAAANSGVNVAVGNISTNESDLEQDASILSNNDDAIMVAGIVAASNDGTASNTSDGEANITTGKASAAGNRSETVLAQNADANVDGLGFVVNTQLGVVGNVGVGVANSGVNFALGNGSDNAVDLDQDAEIASDNGDDATLIGLPTVTAANGGTAENVSDGTADIRTGDAQATGNASATHFTQDADGHVNGFGFALNTQVGGVLNAGIGVANSGGNLALGNISDNAGRDGVDLEQDAEILSNNDAGEDDDVTLIGLGPVTAANQATASNTSDGTGTIRTGGAQGQGNVSSTFFGQGADSTVDGAGAVVSTQVGGVANLGVGIANSGINASVGNFSENDSDLEQNALIGSRNDLGDDLVLAVVGPTTASNSAEASNTSDGNSHIGTGGALATGNASATNLSQHQDNDVDGLGLVLGTQVAGVANVGVGVANSGINASVANVSDNDIDDVNDPTDPAEQDAELASDTGDPFSGLILGGATAANDGSATNTSDGDACICTGDAVASGNVSSTTLIQDLNLTAGTGIVVLTEAGGVLNAGLGLANTGINGAVGNSSENDVEFDQDATINDAIVDLPVVGPQTAHNGGNAANTSDGSGHVGSGNASGTGNQSTTDFVQAATVDGGFAFSTLAGGTANAGVGLANTGVNLGVGNNSTNRAILDQDADGAGIVSNQGEATNDSDGNARIGDPDCCEGEAPPEAPGQPGLPRTGAELETQAAVALMLLLLGFGLRRRSRQLA